MIVIIKAGDTYTSIKSLYGDFEDWFIQRMELAESEYIIHQTGDYNTIPSLHNCSGIIITGSHTMITKLNITKSPLCKWLLKMQNAHVPILGICFGHHLLAMINGGSVGYNVDGTQIGCKQTVFTKAGNADKLIGNFTPSLTIYKAHSQSVLALPKTVKVLSHSPEGMIDAFRVGQYAWGLQFHPEFNGAITQLYLQELHGFLTSKGIDTHKASKGITELHYGIPMLSRFKEAIALYIANS